MQLALLCQDQEPTTLKTEPAAAQQTTQAPEQDETHSIGHGMAM